MKVTRLATSFRGLCDYCSSVAVVRYGPASKNGVYACKRHQKNARKDAQ